MDFKEFYIMHGGTRLHAKLHMPKSEKKQVPIVVFSPGLYGDIEEPHNKAIAETIVDCGFACLRIELYGHGQSDGETSDHTMMDWITELIYVVDEVRSWDEISDIYLSGHSQGGFAAMYTAAMKSDQIKGILLFSPAMCIPDLCRSGHFFDAVFDPEHIPESVWFWDEKYCLHSNYFRTGRMFRLEDAFEGYDGPVFLVQGSADDAVELHYALEAEKQYSDCTLVISPDDTHVYDLHLDMILEKLKIWLYDQR